MVVGIKIRTSYYENKVKKLEIPNIIAFQN